VRGGARQIAFVPVGPDMHVHAVFAIDFFSAHDLYYKQRVFPSSGEGDPADTRPYPLSEILPSQRGTARSSVRTSPRTGAARLLWPAHRPARSVGQGDLAEADGAGDAEVLPVEEYASGPLHLFAQPEARGPIPKVRLLATLSDRRHGPADPRWKGARGDAVEVLRDSAERARRRPQGVPRRHWRPL
jgi:hypothetical protein